MPILQIRDLPDDLHASLRHAALRNHRSIAQQAIIELRKAQGLDSRPRHAALERLRSGTSPLAAGKLPDLEALIRSDRDR